ncbi:MAG: hypothetical protein DLM58_09445 [Pseudonocardiales bacterium]|nr:MAG: hypothetical protein DLM58_09445 [Pseudonocardiales bacterium]
MTDHHPTMPDELDARLTAEANSRRCPSQDAGLRCQLVADHQGWPHLHRWTEWTKGRTRLVSHIWQWDAGRQKRGHLVERGPSDAVPPWAACGRP